MVLRVGGRHQNAKNIELFTIEVRSCNGKVKEKVIGQVEMGGDQCEEAKKEGGRRKEEGEKMEIKGKK